VTTRAPLYTVPEAVAVLNARVQGHAWTARSLWHAIRRGQLGAHTRKLGGRRVVDVEGWLRDGTPTVAAVSSAPLSFADRAPMFGRRRVAS